MARARITIVGLGLVGASLGLAIRKARPEVEVVGHDASSDATHRAQKLGAIEKSEWNLINACERADVLVLATPVQAVREIMQVAGPYMQNVRVVTDTAGSKSDVMGWAQKLLPDVPFVGGDPIVGSLDGASVPRADLFQGVTYCLCPAPATSHEAVNLVVGLVELLGAQPYFVGPAEHDGLIGVADHLSFMLSTALLRMVASRNGPTKIPADMHRLIGPTFRRAAGYSSEDPLTYRDLCVTNKDSIVRWIGEMRDNLDELSALVQEGDEKKLESLFSDSYATRQVVSRTYHDPDQEAQSDAIRSPNSFGLTDLLVGRRLSQARGKPGDSKKGK
jgi:prephenate dehydrogenase